MSEHPRRFDEITGEALPARMACPRCKGEFDGSPNFCPHCGLAKGEIPKSAPDAVTPPVKTSPLDSLKQLPWWAWVLVAVGMLLLLGSLIDDYNDPDVQNPVVDSDSIDLDETPEQKRIVAFCEAQLDDYYEEADRPSQELQMIFYKTCLRAAGYVEAGGN